LEGSPPSGDARIEPVADARAARAALAAAGAGPNLDEALKRAAELLCARFNGDHASFFVHYGEHQPHVAAAGNLPMDEQWLMRWVQAPDRDYRAGVASNVMPLIADLAVITRTPSQEDCYRMGARSGMHLPLLDECGEMLGLVSVCARRVAAFDQSELEELRELAALSASFIRRALLLEQMQLERDLLAHEAALLVGLANAETAGEAMQMVAERTREAALASVVVILARPFETDELEPVSAPAAAFQPSAWAALRAAMNQPGNARLLVPEGGNCYVNHDLRTSAPTPVEEWLRDSFHQRAVLIANGCVTEERRFVIAAGRENGERWEASVVAFVSRITNLLAMTIDRQRTRSRALQQSARLASQARLLTALDPTRPIGEIAATFAEEIRLRYDVECLAILQWPRPDTEALMLYRSPRLLDIPAGRAIPAPEDYGVLRSGEIEYREFGSEEPADEVQRLLYRSGVRRVARIPLAVEGATSGFVSVTWDDAVDPEERLAELEHAVRPLALVIERASLLADIEHQRRTLEVAADILASLATATEMEEAGGLTAERLRLFFNAGLGNDELTILSDVAAPLAMLLERARVLTTLQRQTQRTQAVLDILAALGPRDTISEVAQPVAEALRTMYGVEHCSVNALDAGTIVLAGIDSELGRWTTGTAVDRSEVFDRVVQDGFHIDDADEDDPGRSNPGEVLQPGAVSSSLRVLIGRREEPLGFVTVRSTTGRRFTESDARELARIVQPLGVVISYFRDKRQAEQRTLKLEYTNRILTRLGAGGTAEHLAAGFLAECRVLFGCAHGVAMYFNPDEGVATLLSADSTVMDVDAMPRVLPLYAVHAGRLFAQPIPHYLEDVRDHPIPGDTHAKLIEAGLLSSLQAPLIVQDKVRGAISLWAVGAGRFDSEDADLLGTLSRPLALALEKASALESLGESELKYRSPVAQAEEMIFQFDSETRAILDANAHTGRSLGYTQAELLTLRLDDILDSAQDDIASHIAATLQDGELHLVDRHFVRKDGTHIDVDLVASLVSYGRRQAVLVLARDVSERKAFQRQLVQGQKMEALGTMAGHVAHDFNNLLTTILGFAGLLKRSPNMDSEERENLGLIEDAARRAADLTGHLLAFARGGLVRFGAVDLRTVVHDTMRLAEPSLHASLKTSVTLPDSPVIVEGDGGQLQHALFNIVSNARDAMPEGGDIDIVLRSDGVIATVTITDNGPGMDDETRTRIFEPFYTTKPVGTGTGLGMAITYGIIQGHHGDIALDSQKGRGTAFAVTLPLLPGGTNAMVIDAFNAGEGNLVLVVDDDEMVRRTTSATLASLGYNVVEAPGGATAVEIVRARPERFSVVLLDLVMPGMTGSETFRALTAIRPDLPVVVCTGYAADAHIDMEVKRRIAGLVQKPFTGERLQRALLAAGAFPTRVGSQ
jgi:PAS domain S-box-containing protein